jgi:zinc transporter, ZIP family
MWMIYIAAAIDLFSDGLMIGAGTAVGLSLALVLGLGQVLADVPEGFATIATLRDKGVPRQRRLLLAAFALLTLLVTVLAYFLLRNQSETLKMAALVFTAGLLLVAAVEDMITEAHESVQDAPGSILAMIGGFVLCTFVSAGRSSNEHSGIQDSRHGLCRRGRGAATGARPPGGG